MIRRRIILCQTLDEGSAGLLSLTAKVKYCTASLSRDAGSMTQISYLYCVRRISSSLYAIQNSKAGDVVRLRPTFGS